MEKPETNNLESENQRKVVPANPAQLENVFQLLHSGTNANIELALELLTSGVGPKNLFATVFAIGLIHPQEEIRLKACQVLYQGANAETKAFLDTKLRDVLVMEYLDQMHFLSGLAGNAFVDGHAFAKMAAKIEWFYQPLYVQEMTGAELKEELIRDNSLHFMNKYFPRLPKGIYELESLDHLQLCMLRLKEVPEGLDRIRQLKGLDLNDNKLRSLPDWFANMSSLEDLSMAMNDFREIPPILGMLPKLRKLSISRNPIKNLPASLADYPALRSLDLDGLGFETFPEVLFQIPQLEELDLSSSYSNPWDAIPPSVGRFKQLKSLTMMSHNFKTLPQELAELPLEKLSFWSSKMETMPDWLPTMTSLRSLDLFLSADFHGLPERIGDLINLEFLNLSGTSVSVLPQSFAALQNLKKLLLPGVRFADEVAAFGILSQLKSLEEVNDLDYPNDSFSRKLQAAMPHVRFGG